MNTTLPQALKGTGYQGYVTGQQALQIEFDQTVTGQLPVIIGVVIAVAFLLIMTAFRSPLLAVKAAVLNLFSIAAAYGVVVAVFQWGWGSSLLGVDQDVPIEAYVPMIMFAIVFGLSMDYEVFLLSRVKEAWDRSSDQHLAVGGRSGQHRPGDQLRRADHDRGVPVVRDLQPGRDQAAVHRARGQHPHRRDHRPAAARARGDVPVRHRFLVDTALARPPAAPHRRGRRAGSVRHGRPGERLWQANGPGA